MAQEKKANPVALARLELGKLETEIASALPAQIPRERFSRVVMTALQNNPDLLNCERRSLWNSVMRAAQDGLLPDGREGAIVPYKGVAQWMPMIGGIRKKARNSGEIATWDVHAVYENDAFEYELGDDPYIRHKPALGERGKLVAVYSVATLKGGEKSRDIMSVAEVEKIRALSRAANGPWSNPTFYAEMAKKTVARRHSKVLPMSSDLDDLIRRDDRLYDLEGASDAATGPKRLDMAGRLAALAQPAGDVIDTETGEVIEDHSTSAGKNSGTGKREPSKSEGKPESAGSQISSGEERRSPDDEPSEGENQTSTEPRTFSDDEIEAAFQRGEEAKAKGMSRKAIPPEWKAEGFEPLGDAWVRGFTA